jgi:hypothetical protein
MHRWGIALILLAGSAQAAGAQVGGFSTGPGFGPSPGFSASPGFGAPAAPPPACQELLTLRDETQKHGIALQKASERKVPPAQACPLFKSLIAAEAKFIKALEQNGSTCGVPADIPKKIKAQHERLAQIGKRVCDAAAQGPRSPGPTLSDALGTTRVPSRDTVTTGRGTFDTLTGNPLAR